MNESESNGNRITVSIIVPVYNVKEYLPKCLDSITAQTFNDFECILINDGSTDGSKEICEEYTARDNRFKLINKDNGGYLRHETED